MFGDHSKIVKFKWTLHHVTRSDKLHLDKIWRPTGAIRGCGRQMTAACLNLSTFWGIGVPLAAFLGFKASLGVKGFWLGVSVSAWAQVFTMLIFIGCLDWEQEALRAAALVQSNKEGDYKKLDDEENAFEVMHLKSEADSWSVELV